MQLGRRRGRPHKIPKEPTYDDFPINGTAEDKKKWFHRKNMENWRYNKLTSGDSAEYHRAENDRATKCYYEKKLREKEMAEGLEGVDVIPEEDIHKIRQQELSRQR